MAKRGGLGRGLDSLIPASYGNVNRKEQKDTVSDSASANVENSNNAEINADSKVMVDESGKKAEIKTETKTDNTTNTNSGTAAQKDAKKNTKKDTKKENTDAASKETVINNIYPMEIKLSQVEPNKEQPRSKFDEEALEDLAESIKAHGIIQPIVAVKKDKHYQIVSGERRWRAAKIAGLKTVPVIVKEFSEQDIMEISLIENIQRENLNPIEEALAYHRLVKEFHLKQEEIAKRVGKARAAVANSLRLLKLDDLIQQMLIDGKITNGHAKVLLGLDNKDEQYDLATRIVEEGLSVRELEELVKELKEEPEQKEDVPDQIQEEDEQTKLYYQKYENLLRNLMGTKVNIKKKKNDRGKIEIEYYSMDELERLLAMLQHCE